MGTNALLVAAALVLLTAPAFTRRAVLTEASAVRGEAGEWRREGSPELVAAEGQQQRRSLHQAVQQGGGGTAVPHEPLPNFEIGVPAPPKKSFREWQVSGVRERQQEFSSGTFLMPGHPGLGYVAICVVARDAHADMLEWISHHVRLGVSKIYLWDHASQPPMRSVVQGYIAAGIVEYQHFAEFQHPSGKPQLYAYDQCLQRGHLHTWMAFIDVDEFLMFRDPWPSIQSLPAFLTEFEGPAAPPRALSGLAVHWLIFGSSGHEARPAGGVLRSYHRCLQLRHAQHALVKTIVRTACTAGVEGPHNFVHNCSLPVLQTDKTPILGARSEEPVHVRLALHHYAIKSREEFALKMVRGSAMKRQRGWEFFDFVDEWSTEWNWDGLLVWDTEATFQHYPAVTEEHLKRYTAEQHEDFWLKGADDPRYQEQQRQQQEAAAAAQQAQQQQQAQQAQQAAAEGAAGGAQQAGEQQGGAQQEVQQQQLLQVQQVAGAGAQDAAAQLAGNVQQQGLDAAAQQAAAAAQQQQMGAGAVLPQEQQQQAAAAAQQQATTLGAQQAAAAVGAQQAAAAAAGGAAVEQQQAAGVAGGAAGVQQGAAGAAGAAGAQLQ